MMSEESAAQLKMRPKSEGHRCVVRTLTQGVDCACATLHRTCTVLYMHCVDLPDLVIRYLDASACYYVRSGSSPVGESATPCVQDLW